eukprot:s5080_g1.t1
MFLQPRSWSTCFRDASSIGCMHRMTKELLQSSTTRRRNVLRFHHVRSFGADFTCSSGLIPDPAKSRRMCVGHLGPAPMPCAA